MWTKMISEIMFYKDLDIEEDKIELSKIEECMLYKNKYTELDMFCNYASENLTIEEFEKSILLLDTEIDIEDVDFTSHR